MQRPAVVCRKKAQRESLRLAQKLRNFFTIRLDVIRALMPMVMLETATRFRRHKRVSRNRSMGAPYSPRMDVPKRCIPAARKLPLGNPMEVGD